ncbi:hypothetical protein Btru_025288 [Bulinus truncatus]|nr:hypothetical protein Btru_025288 [Bulinus truncatus]
MLDGKDPTYTQAIFTSGIEPYDVKIDPDPQDTTNQYKFTDYFTDQWNTTTNKYTVRMTRGIDRDGNLSTTAEDVNILQYKITCKEIQGSSNVEYKILKIQILDVNDNSPYFINAPYTVRVNELTPVGVTVFRGILADDIDEGPNKQITYILTPGISQFNFNGTQYFYLPSDQEGILSVSSPLDFESMYRQTGDISQTFYNITVIARDNAQPASSQRSRLTTLRVIITDGDDQGPEFVYPSCIQSSQANSKSCIRPKYLTVYSGNSSEINLDLKPDPSDSSNPTVYMLMQDRDTLNSTVTCTIRQTEPAGYESYFTTRSSLYSGKQYRCEVIKLANKIFNRANISSLEIVIEAVEQSANLRVDYATVVMSVDIFNLNLPIITYNSNIGYIYENYPVGSRVYSDSAANTTLMKLTFTDPDRSSSDPPSQFDISVSNGPFSVTQEGYVQLNNAVLDYETVKLYTFTVTITKQAVPRYSASVSLTVNVLDLNDNYPVVLTPDSYIVSVPQGNYSTSPRLLVTVQATDVDFGPVVYSLSRVSPSNGTSKFAVSRPSGAVTLQNSVMAGEIYTVYVTVADQGNPVRSVETVVVVTVTPLINQAPSFQATQYTIYVSEGVPVSSSLFTLPVTDPDTPISSLTFTLTNESPPQTNSFFTLNGLNLNNLRTFDRESIPEHNITVTVRDPEGNSAQTVITVKVLDINDNDPTFTSPSYTFTVAEGQPVGTTLGSVTMPQIETFNCSITIKICDFYIWCGLIIQATDSDQPNTPNSAVSYSIVPAVDSDLFTISPSNGQLTTNFVFGYEVKKQYVIFVKASDNGSPSCASVIPVTINITDINDNVPLFEETTKEVSVYENEVNALVLSIKASDADSVPNINFVLNNIGSSIDANSFNVATVGKEARITVRGSLDYETKNLYSFTLTTTDGQSSTNVFAKVTVIVHVLDKNDNAPVISPLNANVNVLENVPLGYELVNISATDADATAPYNQLIYRISSISPSSNLFTIVTDTGKLVVANSLQLNRITNVYTVTVTVSDISFSPLSASATVTVTIVRNRPPVFSPTSITATTANETLPVNSVIATVTATDPDTGITLQFAGLSYSLVPDSRINNLFLINSTTGSVRVKSNLASVSDSSFVLGVIATDNGGLTATATVTVPMNRNLYDPEFTTLSYTREIPENFALGDSVAQLLARDLDANVCTKH